MKIKWPKMPEMPKMPDMPEMPDFVDKFEMSFFSPEQRERLVKAAEQAAAALTKIAGWPR